MDAKVLVVGAGGLGGPVALYLGLAGVGTIGLVDFDVVDLSNLQRQVLHNSETVGMSKVESAIQTLNRYNPDVNVVPHEFPINAENAMDLIAQYDIVVNGADNFATRYLVNDAAYLSGRPIVDGASSSSTARSPFTNPARAATAASSRSRRRPASFPTVLRPASSVRSPAPSAASRPRRRSNSSSASAKRSPDACSSWTRSTWSSALCVRAGTPRARSAATTPP